MEAKKKTVIMTESEMLSPISISCGIGMMWLV